MIDSENTDISSIYLKNYVESKSNFTENNNIKFIELLSDILTEICKENKSNEDDKLNLIKPFMSKNIPFITSYDYIERLYKYSKVSNETLILTLIYIDRICVFYQINLNYYIIHKLFLASFIISIKYHEDSYYSMKYYAKLGGVSLKEMNHLECEFVKLIRFDLFVSDDLFKKYKNSIIKCEDDY